MTREAILNRLGGGGSPAISLSDADLLSISLRASWEYPSPTISQEAKTTVTDVVRWTQELDRLHAQIVPRFARPEPRRRALAFLHGILSTTPRKNGWQLAEHAREARPDGINGCSHRRFGIPMACATTSVPTYWNSWVRSRSFSLSMKRAFSSRAIIRRAMAGNTAEPPDVLRIVRWGVFLSYVTGRSHALIDRELYLPLDWCKDRERCRSVGIPDSVCFQTKPQLAQSMLERIEMAQIPVSWVVADSVYGGNADLRTWLEAHHYPYALTVACNEPVGVQTPLGRRREEAALVEAFFPQLEWRRLSIGDGTKGPRLFDWAIIPMLHQWQDDGCHWLLIHRSLTDPTEKGYFFVFAPPYTPLSEMVQAIGARWCIETDFVNTKDLGLDHYEVRSFIGWYRHITLVLLAAAFLAGVCTSTSDPSRPAALAPQSAVLPLTLPEVRHLLAQLIWPYARSAPLILTWSWWRRKHQSRARYHHTQRRLKAV